MDQKEGASIDLLSKLEQEQENNGWISERALKKIAKQTQVPISRIYAVTTFYSHLHIQKQGQYVIEICNSPSCYLNGSLDIIEEIERTLKIKSGETTKDGRFSLHIGSCICCCDKAPAMLINKKVFGNLTKKKIKTILKECKSSNKHI